LTQRKCLPLLRPDSSSTNQHRPGKIISDRLAISIVYDHSSFSYNKPFWYTTSTPGQASAITGLQFTPHSFPSGVLLVWPTRLLPQDGLKNTCPPSTLIISTLPSYYLPLSILHVPCVSHSPHAKNRCDSIGSSARTEVRLAGKVRWGVGGTHQTQHVAVVMSPGNVR
jgi:hypothetical protein